VHLNSVVEGSRHGSVAQLWAQAIHDLRQPVQAALLVARMAEEVRGRAELARSARQVAAALESLQGMLEVLALLARIDAGLYAVSLRPCQLAHVLEGVMRETAESASLRGIALRQRNMRGLVLSSPELLAVVARSLLLNAIKFGSGQEIRASCHRRDAHVSLEVQFRGAPLDGGDARNAFVQLSPLAKHPSAGELGLSLSLLEHLCQRLGHPLSYTRQARNGQRLTLLLPLARSAR
jgi:signal transduction histidine kinase